MRIFNAITVVSSSLLNTSMFANDALNSSGALPLKKEYQGLQERVSQWDARARFGLFCDWRLLTGSSNVNVNEARCNTIAEFKAAARDLQTGDGF